MQILGEQSKEVFARDPIGHFQSGMARGKCPRALGHKRRGVNPGWGAAMIKHLFVGWFSATLLALPAVAAELRVPVMGVRSDKGELLIALYDNADGFANALANAATRGLVPDSGRLIGTAIRSKTGNQSTIFTQLLPGRYMRSS